MKTSIREHVPLAPYTTLSIGGPARYFIHAETENRVMEAVRFAAEKQVPILILGGGSNMLVADAGFPGLVLHVGIKGIEWFDEGNRVRLTAGAGEEWDNVVAQCVDRDLAGIECLSGIPGSVGGTPVQNVGAYGQEVSETLTSVRACDRQSGEVVELGREECVFGYRSSVFNSSARDRYIVLNVTYTLWKTRPPQIQYADVRKEFENVGSLRWLRFATLSCEFVPARRCCCCREIRIAAVLVRSLRIPLLTPQAFANLELRSRAWRVCKAWRAAAAVCGGRWHGQDRRRLARRTCWISKGLQRRPRRDFQPAHSGFGQ